MKFLADLLTAPQILRGSSSRQRTTSSRARRRRQLLARISTLSSLILVISVVLQSAVDDASAQVLIVTPYIPFTPLPFPIDAPEFFLVAIPLAGFLFGLNLRGKLPIKIRPGRLAPFLDATSTDRLANVTSAFSADNNVTTATRGCSAEAMTVFDAVRCRFNQSATFDYRTLLRTFTENNNDTSSMTDEEKRQLWYYSLARELASYAVDTKSPPDVADDKLSALTSNEIRGSRRRTGRFSLFNRSPSSVPSAPPSSSSIGSSQQQEEGGGGEAVLDEAVAALVTSDWKSCLAEMVCEMDKASRKYGLFGRFGRQEYGNNFDDEDNEVEQGSNGWIFGPRDCSEEYKRCRFNFKHAARSLFRRR